MTNQESAAAYRRLADMLETTPEMPQPYEGSSGTMLFFCDSKESLAATVRAFGKGVKEDGGDSINFIPEFPLRIKIIAFKSNCCMAVEHTRIVPATVIPAQPAREATEERLVPEHEETVTEYVCSPILESEVGA